VLTEQGEFTRLPYSRDRLSQAQLSGTNGAPPVVGGIGLSMARPVPAAMFGSCAYTNYFRSTTKTATWIWSRESDQSGPALAAATAVASSYNLPVNLASLVGYWQHGIGNPLLPPSTNPGTIVSVSTVTSVDAFYLVNWVSPDS
jgi:hypothetical protein